MKQDYFVLQTAQGGFISLHHIEGNTLQAVQEEAYIYGQVFDVEEEAENVVELMNTGKSTSPTMRKDWKIDVDKELLPVRKRIMATELMEFTS
jgi:hypothetical protein